MCCVGQNIQPLSIYSYYMCCVGQNIKRVTEREPGWAREVWGRAIRKVLVRGMVFQPSCSILACNVPACRSALVSWCLCICITQARTCAHPHVTQPVRTRGSLLLCISRPCSLAACLHLLAPGVRVRARACARVAV